MLGETNRSRLERQLERARTSKQIALEQLRRAADALPPEPSDRLIDDVVKLGNEYDVAKREVERLEAELATETRYPGTMKETR